MTVESSQASSRSSAAPSDGARERERVGSAGVRPAVVLRDGCLEDGRCEKGIVAERR